MKFYIFMGLLVYLLGIKLSKWFLFWLSTCVFSSAYPMNGSVEEKNITDPSKPCGKLHPLRDDTAYDITVYAKTSIGLGEPVSLQIKTFVIGRTWYLDTGYCLKYGIYSLVKESIWGTHTCTQSSSFWCMFHLLTVINNSLK